MELKKKIIILCITAMLMATNVWAGGTVTIIKQLNSTENNAAGTVTSQVSEASGLCTLTVTPADGNYITVDFITAERTISGNLAQGRLQAPSMENSIAVTATDATADPSGETTYTFSMPDADYDVEVVAKFQSRISIADAVVTLDESSFTYDGQAKEPAVSSVVLGNTTLTQSTDYTFEYTDNTDAGTGTVTVTGQGIYTGTATATFTINKAALDFSVGIDGWTYGDYDEQENVPYTEGLEDIDVIITYYYKVKDAADNTYTTTVPTNAGEYTVRAAVAESDNYQAGEATADFTIAKAELGNVSVTLEGWTYGDDANTPVVNGNTGNGTVTYEYSRQSETSENWISDVPSNAGSYAIRATIAESDNFLGTTARSNFTIFQADFSQVVIADIADQTFTGEAITPAITVTFKGNAVDASDYDARYASNTNVGTASVTLISKGINFYGGQVDPSKTFQIVAAAATITGEDMTVTYNGQAQDYTGGSVDNGTLVITYYNSESERNKGSNALEASPTNAGDYYVQLTQGDANYSSEPVNVTFTIEAKTLTDDMLWTEGDDFLYTGEAIILEGMYGLRDDISGDEVELVEDKDFTVEYDNNTNVGTATVTFTGIGNYQGTVTYSFQIMRELSVSFFENNWATYYAAEDLATPEGIDAYIVTGVNGTEVTADKIQYIPQGVAVLLYASEPMEDMVIAEAWQGEVNTFDNNLLQGCATATAVSALTAENNIYVLYNNEFVKTISGTIPANRCYLPIAKNQSGEARLTIIVDDSTVSGIDATLMNNEERAMSIYDLQGRRISSAEANSCVPSVASDQRSSASLFPLPSSLKKGLYIVNGKKIVVK